MGDEPFVSARAQLAENSESDSDGEDADHSGEDNSDTEAFLSARQDDSDWYQEIRRRPSSTQSPMMSARSDQFWTPRDLDDSMMIPELEKANTFRPNLMPQEFEKIFSKTRNGRHKDVEAMLDKGAPIDGQDPYGNTILHTACQNGHRRIVKACLRRGCDTNAQNIKGHTPLHYCFAYGYSELGQYLVEKGGASHAIRNNFGLYPRDGIGNKTASKPANAE